MVRGKEQELVSIYRKFVFFVFFFFTFCSSEIKIY